VREIQHLLSQLSRRNTANLSEAMFMSFTRYENDRLDGVMKKLDTSEP
jgi:hypothetical protein